MKISLIKFGDILTSRPAGRDAALSLIAYMKPKKNEPIKLDFKNVLSVGPSWLDEFLTILRKEFGKKRVIILPTNNASVRECLRVIDDK